MSKSKELFEQIREDEIQDCIFVQSDLENAYLALQKEANKEEGKIIVIEETKEEERLPF